MHPKPAQLATLATACAALLIAGCDSEPTAPAARFDAPTYDIVADQTRVGDTDVHKGSHSGNLLITDLSAGTFDAEDLAQSLVGEGVTILNVNYQGSPLSAGRFTAGTSTVGIDEGVILSSGRAVFAHGPNDNDGVTGSMGTPGDPALTALTGRTSRDAAILEFDFIPSGDEVFVQYVFASDEYNEFVNSQFDDAFAFFVNGVNCAVTPSGQRVSINTINNGNPFGTTPSSHPELYRNNDLQDGGGGIDTEMDGLTTVLTCQADVIPGVVNHMRLTISDMSDTILDSNVFLKAGSFGTEDPTDTDAPSCAITGTGTNAMGQKFIRITVEDDGSGLGTVTVTKQINTSVDVPAFTPGTTDPVVVTATKVDQTKSSSVALLVTDESGNSTACDPIDVTITRETGQPHNASFSDIPAAEHWVTVRNGTPGLTNLAVIVNGENFQVAGLASGAERTIDIASAMRPGTDNTIRLIPKGRPGGSAWVMIHD